MFDGLRVVAFESRRAAETAELIRKQGGDAFVAPSMRERPIEENPAAFAFAEKLFRGEIDTIIFLTGVGTKALDRVLATRYPGGQFAEALRHVTVVVRGPKPTAVLREMNVPITVTAPPPNTWREVLSALDGRPLGRVAVQEYGRSNHEFLDALRARGAEVMPVRVYQWDLPEDTAPLVEAARRIASVETDITMFTTSAQIDHLLLVAADPAAVLAGLRKTVVASIGPTTTEALEEHGVAVDLEPSQGKLGILVRDTAERAAKLLEGKRA